MAACITGILQPELSTKIINSKLLIVGAGGIGCEVLKNCVLSGFKDITIVGIYINKFGSFKHYCILFFSDWFGYDWIE